MNKLKLHWTLIPTILLMLFGMFSLKQEVQATTQTYDIGTDITFAPFEFQDSNEKYVGIDIDLLKAIAKDQNFEVNLKPLGFDSSVQGVQSGQIDGMIAGMSITDERKKSFDFSDPYFDSGIQMAIDPKNKNIKTYQDLKGKTVAAKVGTESAAFLEKNQDKYQYKIKNFDDATGLYQALANGETDAIFDDYPVLGYAISNGQKLKMIGEKQAGNAYGFAVKKGTNTELLQKFNHGLANMKKNGQYDKIVQKYIATGTEGKTIASKNQVDESTFSGFIKNNWKRLASGLWMTIELTLISFALALVVGIIFGLFSVAPQKPLRILASIYVDIIRGIPLMVLAFFIYFGMPGMLGFKIPVMVAGIVTLTLNASAYISEIIRGGINAVPKGQMEASRSLGVPYGMTMRKVILPQAVKIMIPSFINQFVISLKDTTILSAIGLIELLQTGKIIVARTLQSTMVYFVIALIYLILITSLTKLAKRLEKKVD